MHKISVFILSFILISTANSQGLFESALTSTDSTISSSPLHGFLRSVCYSGKNNNTEGLYMQSIYTQLGISADIDFNKYGKAYFDFRYRFGNEYGVKTDEIKLHRGYVDLYFSALQLRLGKQSLNWGAASFVNPSDQFSPKNPGIRSPDISDIETGHWMLNAELAVSSNSSLQFIWIPIYEHSNLLSDGLEYPEYMEFRSPSLLPEAKNSSFGFNYDLRSKFADLALSFYHGYRNFPALRFDTATFNQLTFAPEYIAIDKDPYKVNSLSLNLTVPLSSYLFRIETNWLNIVENEDIERPSLSEISYCAEIEQSGSSVSIIGGYYGKYVIDFTDVDIDPSLLTGELPDLTSLFPPGSAPDLNVINSYLQEQLYDINRLYEYQAEEFYHAVYAIAKVSLFNESVDLEIPGMYNFTTKEITIMPSLSFSITDNLKFQCGAYALYGDDNSLYDIVAPKLNAFYLLLKASF